MTIGAVRRQLVAARNSLPVNAGHERVLNVGVALAASCGHIEFVDGRSLFIGGQDLMRTMTIRADGGLLRSVLHGAAVHALLIREEWLRAPAVRLHQKLLSVTAAAGLRNIDVIDRRLRVRDCRGFVRAAMAIDTRGGGRFSGGELRVGAVAVGGLRVGVALRTGNLFGGRVVCQAFDVGVAINACEHAAMHGVLQLACIDEKAVRFSVYIFAQRGVVVAGEAVLIFQLMLGIENRNAKKKTEEKGSEQKSI